MVEAETESVVPEGENPWPLFPEQPIVETSSGGSIQPRPRTIRPEDRAAFWRRAAAFSIDLSILEWITLFFMWLGTAAEDLAMAQTSGRPLLESLQAWGTLHTRIGSLLFLVYFSFFSFYGGRTPGKMILGIRVVTGNGLPLTWVRATFRTLCYYLDLLTLGLGFLMAAFPPWKRALHDLVTRTAVIRTMGK